MRTALSVILFAVSAFGQDSSAISAAKAACGPKGANFDVKDDNSQHTLRQPEAGKALVYVIQDVGEPICIGAWAGKVYFFRNRILGGTNLTFFDIEPVDSDLGKLFVATVPLSISHPKK